MKPAVVIGRVWGTRKYQTFEGKKLLLIQPTDWKKNPVGDAIVACDAVGAGAGEFVFYVSAREAAVAFPELPPCDAAILGIIDNVHIIE